MRDRPLRSLLLIGLLAVQACDPLSLFGSGFSGDPRLDVAWNTARTDSFAPGHITMNADSAGTTGRIYVPTGYQADTPMGLLVMLHGGGSSGLNYIGLFQTLANDHNFIVLAPDSKQLTWDMISTTKVGVDVTRLGAAIDYVLSHASIDPERIWLGGHSDGASYALTLGTANGDHFRKLLIFAAGIYWTPQKLGRPPVRVMHGQLDPVFPFSQVNGEVVRPLERAGYDVTFVPVIGGGHEIGSDVATAAVLWLTGAAEASAQQSAQINLGRR